MTIAKPNHKAARALFLKYLDLHPGKTVNTDLDPLEMGLVGDQAHAGGGDSYHLGKSQIRARNGRDRYSVDESPRDVKGLDDYSCGVDIGYFKVTTGRGTFDLYAYNRWLIAMCEKNDPDTADLREVIYSPDGRVVRRWDRMKKRTAGDGSHLFHTHMSEFRDADGHRMLRLATRWLQHIGLIPDEQKELPVDQKDFDKLMTAWATSPAGRSAMVNTQISQVDDVVAKVLEGPRGQKAIGKGVATYIVENARKDPKTGLYPPVSLGDLLRWSDVRAARTNEFVIDGSNAANTKLNAILEKLGLTAEQIAAFDAREAAEVPVTVEQMRALLAQAIPDGGGPVTPEQAREAVLELLRRALTAPAT